MKSGRGLSLAFINALQNRAGLGLNRILEAVRNDQTLDLEIRENYLNLYYRGGSLLRLAKKGEQYLVSFDRRYVLHPENTRLPATIGKQCHIGSFDDLTVWLDAIPVLKQEMDGWFSIYPKVEREFQQVMVRENNCGHTARSTDYYICDIEYANEDGRFDLIAAHWRSSSSYRKNNRDIGLAFIEMKYLNAAMANTAGILAHVLDMACYYRKNLDNFACLKHEMRTVFNQKLQLGLIHHANPIESFDQNPPDFILALANHDPDSRILLRELEQVQAIEKTLPFAIKFSVSNFMGYGLYDPNIYDLGEFMNRFSRQIYTKSEGDIQ